MVVRDENRRRVEQQGLLDQFARVHLGAVDRAEEQLGIVDQPVPAVEKDDGEDLALQARQLVAEEVARNRRIRERRATMHALVDHRSEEHTSELQSLMRTSSPVFFSQKKTTKT